MFQGNFKVVSRVFQGLFKEVSSVFQASFKGVEEGVKVILRESLGSYKGGLRVFQRYIKEVLRKYSRCYKEVSCCMALIAATRAEGGIVYSFTFIWVKCQITTTY